MMAKVVYDEMIDIARDYLGPAAGRFISSQIEFHLKMEPDQINLSDIPKLESWLRVSLAMISDDESSINEFVERLMKMSKS